MSCPLCPYVTRTHAHTHAKAVKFTSCFIQTDEGRRSICQSATLRLMWMSAPVCICFFLHVCLSVHIYMWVENVGFVCLSKWKRYTLGGTEWQKTNLYTQQYFLIFLSFFLHSLSQITLMVLFCIWKFCWVFFQIFCWTLLSFLVFIISHFFCCVPSILGPFLHLFFSFCLSSSLFSFSLAFCIYVHSFVDLVYCYRWCILSLSCCGICCYWYAPKTSFEVLLELHHLNKLSKTLESKTAELL